MLLFAYVQYTPQNSDCIARITPPIDNLHQKSIIEPMENTPQTNTKSIIGFLVFLGVAAGAVALALGNKKNDAMTSTTEVGTSTPEATTLASSTESASSSTATSTPVLTAFKDGVYSATGTYKSPAGIEQINVSVTLEKDIVVETSYKGLAENARSIEYQEKFGSGYRAVVIGKNISTLQLSKVSGSSLTPAGFNDAIGKIRDEAARIQ